MSTPRSRRRSRLRQSSNPSLTRNVSEEGCPRQTQDTSCENAVPIKQGTSLQDAGRNEQTVRTVQDAQGRRSRRRSRQLHTNNLHVAINDLENIVLGRGIDLSVDIAVPGTSDSLEHGITGKADNSSEITSNSLAKEANISFTNDDLQLQSPPNIYESYDKDVRRSSSNEIRVSQKVEDDEITNTENCESHSLSLPGELREVCKGLSTTATKTFVQYFDTIRRKEEENEMIRHLLDEERNRRRFDKCMQQFQSIRGECEMNGIKKGLEVSSSKNEEDVRSITSLLLVEKQRKLLAKCHLELCDRRRRAEVKRLNEIVTQESMKRKELEAKLKSLLPEIKILKSFVDLTGYTSKELKDDGMTKLRMQQQDMESRLDRTSKLLVHTKAQLFDVVNVYQQTNKKVSDLEAAIFKARETARDLFDRGSRILDTKPMTHESASAISNPEPPEKCASMLLNFTQNATWLAGLLASELPPPWQGPHRSLGQSTSSALYDPTGLYTAKTERQGSPGRRSSKINSLTRVNSRSSGSLVKHKKMHGLCDDSDILFSSKSTNLLIRRPTNV